MCRDELFYTKILNLSTTVYNYIPCHSPFSIEHIVTECIDFQPTRVKYYLTSDISQLFHKVHPSSILQYMKDICLYNEL